jgi:plasmid stabilization system protein ParE
VPRKIIFDRDAETDAENARRWYASRNPVAAKRFVAALRAAIRLVKQSPERWPELEPGVRRVLLRRFPYAVIYSVRPDHALGICHTPTCDAGVARRSGRRA